MACYLHPEPAGNGALGHRDIPGFAFRLSTRTLAGIQETSP
jgi:hypothetical protein